MHCTDYENISIQTNENMPGLWRNIQVFFLLNNWVNKLVRIARYSKDCFEMWYSRIKSTSYKVLSHLHCFNNTGVYCCNESFWIEKLIFKVIWLRRCSHVKIMKYQQKLRKCIILEYSIVECCIFRKEIICLD